MIDRTKGEWLDHLPHVLWSYRATPRTATEETPYGLSYGSKIVIPTEIGVLNPRVLNFESINNEEKLCLSLDQAGERRELASIRDAKYK